MPVLGSICLVSPANSRFGSSSHSAVVLGGASSSGSSLVGIGVVVVFVVLPVEVFPSDDASEPGEGEEVFFIRLVLEREVIARYPWPSHVEVEELGGDDG